MRTIIFEGIATSGKSSIEKYLIELLESKRIPYMFIDENITLMPIIGNKDFKKSLTFLNETISFVEERENNKEICILERMQLTHALRTNAELYEFRTIEKKLLKHNPIVIILKVDEEKISERVKWALEHRSQDWARYAKNYGTIDQIVIHYKEQQCELERLAKTSKLPYIIIDTTRMNFTEMANKIYEDYCVAAIRQ